MIPLHKKGARDKLDNYRGVCLLPLISQIIARIFASRIRRWTEKIGALGENQNGFREGRSICDATQTILRVDEEVRGVKGPCKEMRMDRPGAVLLDTTKAYPRVNRPLLWKVLENLGMTKKVLDLMKGLHGETKYRIRGREGLSEAWQHERGLREGDATSPILFNLYHDQSMKLASETRHESARRSGKECGLRWAWVPGGSFPSSETKRTLQSSQSEPFEIDNALFADDSTLLGLLEELASEKEVIKAETLKFHDGKEEVIAFGCETSAKTRMLGTMLGKKEDRAARIKRVYTAWTKVKRWLWRSSLKKRTRTLIVQAVVESTMLFDCSARAWSPTDLQKMQSMLDTCYRFVWNDGRGLPKLRMQREGTNSFEIRRQLGVQAIRTKLETRGLERIGHVLRMPNERTTKRVILGRWNAEREEEGQLKGGTISYWKRLIAEAGHDWTNVENLAKDRKKWKTLVKERQIKLIE